MTFLYLFLHAYYLAIRKQLPIQETLHLSTNTHTKLHSRWDDGNWRISLEKILPRGDIGKESGEWQWLLIICTKKFSWIFHIIPFWRRVKTNTIFTIWDNNMNFNSLLSLSHMLLDRHYHSYALSMLTCRFNNILPCYTSALEESPPQAP